MSTKVEGGCYCKAIRYEISVEPMLNLQCHCRECQYISGGNANVCMVIPGDGFKYTQGTPRQFARKDLENPVTREFCGECGTPLLSRSPAIPGAAIIKRGTFDDPKAFGAPQMAIFTIDRQPYQYVPDGMPAFERMPG
ncbi:MAG: hypothetical protein K0Q76_2046 [Panacagrimonas sp.]|jgi:hypothetical protein|nr:GFA family protein [Panacagrimonas sp.]MCC2656938.1 hypothetical protein [Panacagrimonas sp.]